MNRYPKEGVVKMRELPVTNHTDKVGQFILPQRTSIRKTT